jgi:hypothetical protein
MLKTILVEIYATYHFIPVWVDIKVSGKLVIIDGRMAPLMMYDGFKKAIFFLPEAPCPVIGKLGRFINEQYFFITKASACYHAHQQTEPCATCAYDYVVVFLQCQKLMGNGEWLVGKKINNRE